MEANKRHGVADGWVYRVAINHARRVARRRSMEQRVFRKQVPMPDLPAPAGEI